MMVGIDEKEKNEDIFVDVNGLYTAVYMRILWVSKKRSFNGHKDKGDFRKNKVFNKNNSNHII